MADYTTTMSRDEETGETMVRIWNVYRQQWVTMTATAASDSALMATLPAEDREMINQARIDDGERADHAAANEA